MVQVHHAFFLLTEKAEKMGQNMTKIPFKDTFWKGTTRTRPSEPTLMHKPLYKPTFLHLYNFFSSPQLNFVSILKEMVL